MPINITSSLPILTYHTLDGRGSVISVSPDVFRDSMARLHDSGYQVLRLLEAVECLRKGTPFPERSLVITFDDGYQTVYGEAFGVLKHYRLPATVFLTVGEGSKVRNLDRLPSLHGSAMLAWREIREMQRWGMDFGAHTLTHPDLTRVSPQRAEAEILGSKAIIEDALGAAVESFAYPYGRHDRKSREIVRQHFACACSDRLGLITPGSDPYALERVDMYYLRSERLFNLLGTRLFPWYVRARAIPRRLRRAIYWKP